MRRTEDQVLQSLRAVHAFIASHAVQLRTVTEAGSYHDLGEILARLDGHTVTQASTGFTARASTWNQRTLRKALETHHMRPIARVADVIGVTQTQVGVIRMPTTRLSSGQLVGYAQGMATAAAKFRDDFVRAGLPADFVEQLNAAVERLHVELSSRKNEKASGGASTIMVARNLRVGRKLVRALDSFVLLAAGDDAELMAAWKLAKRVSRPRPARYALVPAAGAPPALAASSEATPIIATARIATEEKAPDPVPRWSLRRLLPTSLR